MRKKRLRGTKREHIGEPRDQHEPGAQGASEETPPTAGSVPGTPAPQPPRGRTARVRNRLTASVALVSVAVLAAGAPAVLGALDDATEAQKLVDLAETNRGTVALAHSLADERDAMTAFVAAGRTTSAGGGVSEDQRARVDRQVEEVRGQVPAALGALLDTLPKIRQQALTGKGSSLDVFDAYTEAVQALNRVADILARKLPADADTGPAPALAPLGRAVEQASATRGLLLAALADRGGRNAADRRRPAHRGARAVRARRLPADSRPATARDAYGRTVNGTEVTTAERYLDRLTDQPRLSGQRPRVDRKSARRRPVRPHRPDARRRVRARLRPRSTGSGSCATTTSPPWSCAIAARSAPACCSPSASASARPLDHPPAGRTAARRRPARRRPGRRGADRLQRP